MWAQRRADRCSFSPRLRRITLAISVSILFVLGFTWFISPEETLTGLTKSGRSTLPTNGGATNMPLPSSNNVPKDRNSNKLPNGSDAPEIPLAALADEDMDYREPMAEVQAIAQPPAASKQQDSHRWATPKVAVYNDLSIRSDEAESETIPAPMGLSGQSQPAEDEDLEQFTNQKDAVAVSFPEGVANAPSQLLATPGLPSEAITAVTIKEKIIHFDLKGSPPKLSYYKEIFPLLKKMGATGLLMEYEDMFPYSGALKVVTAKNAYSRNDVAEIRRLAALNGLNIIPLVQTFGHLEFVLKHEQFRGFREVDLFPQAVCPTRNGTLSLVLEMVSQVLALHPNVTYFHIGADEVFHLGMCSVCSRVQDRPGRPGSAAQKLFLTYIAQLLTALRETHPQIRPIMWDDMFHSMHIDTIKGAFGNLVDYVEPMIWSYHKNWTRHLPRNGDFYADLFPNVWGATAFKGSGGESRQLTDAKDHAQIHTSWIEALRSNGHKFQNFRGIVLTGWSRYDHFSPMCELFPLAIPSLALDMAILSESDLTLDGVKRAAKNINCPVPPKNLDFLNSDPVMEQFSKCKFPGVEIFRSVHAGAVITKQVKVFLDELESNFPEYHSRRGFIQPSRVDKIMTKLGNCDVALFGFALRIRPGFLKVYDENTLNEWVAANVEPLLKKVHEWQNVLESGQNRTTWLARPLNIPAVNVTFEKPVATMAPPPFLPSNMFQAQGGMPGLPLLMARQKSAQDEPEKPLADGEMLVL